MSQNATSPSAHLHLPTYRFCVETQAGLLQNNPLCNTKTVHAFAGYQTMVTVRSRQQEEVSKEMFI